MTPLLINEFITAVRETFQNIPRPLRTKRVALALALDEEWPVTVEKLAELQAKDPETDWKELSDGDLLEHATILPWLDPPAFRFYFPAFLCYTLRHWYAVHGRVHLETMEALWWQPDLVAGLSPAETDLLIAIFSELASTEEGSEYLTGSVPPVLQAHRDRLSAEAVV